MTPPTGSHARPPLVSCGATRRGIGSGYGATNFDYEVDGHTHGFQADFGDQINSANLISASVNYVKSNTYRINNYNYDNTGYLPVSNLTDGTDCYNAYGGKGVAGYRGPCNLSRRRARSSFRRRAGPRTRARCRISREARAGNGATFRLTYTGNQALINGVTPLSPTSRSATNGAPTTSSTSASP